MEEYQYQHYFTVRHEGRTVAAHFSWDGNLVFFQLWRQIFAEFIKYAKYFYYICIRHWEGGFVCNCLISTYKDTNNISLPQLLSITSYTELTYI